MYDCVSAFSMKRLLLFALLSSILIGGCTPLSPVLGMPCHRMPDGSWMGDCENQPQLGDGYLPAQESANSITNSSIIDVADGETIKLSADIVSSFIGSTPVTMLGYNKQIPGPLIRSTEGATFIVEFTNNLDQNTTVHWHGLRHDIKDDGVPGVSQEPIP